MDFARFALARRLESKVSSLLARFPARHRRSALDPETLSLLRGIAWWMASCILAWISLESTRKMTLVEYRKIHRPPLAAWESLLIARGYQRSTGGSLSLPENTFQVQQDLAAVLLPGATPEAPPSLWLKKARSTAEWSDRSFSLQGFEEWVVEIDSAPKTPDKTSPRTPGAGSQGTGNSIDPQEIRY